MSHGRFDEPPETMKRSSDGSTVEACGPIRWNGDESGDGGSAELVTITHVDIKQSSSGAHTQGDRHDEFQRAKDPDWMVPGLRAQGQQRFVDGPADAFARADVQLKNGHVRNERWPEHGTVEVLLSADAEGD